MRKSYLSNMEKVKIHLNNIIIPIKEAKVDLIQDDYDFFIKQDKNEDISLISEIISVDYNNYVHYKNIERILDYLRGNYSNKYNNDNKFEGIGKIFFDNGDYYIGIIRNNLPQRKGILYYKDGSIKYIGEYNNGKTEGFGKYFFEDGTYYIGQWKSNQRKGYGKEYYNNDYIRYEGEYDKDKKEGYGIYVFDDGVYYIGEFKDNILDGIGGEYNQNGSKIFEGIYSDGEKEIGKFYFGDGESYTGEFKFSYPHGKGIQYYKNGKIKYEGDLEYGKRVGFGKYNDLLVISYIGQFENDKPKGQWYNIFFPDFNLSGTEPLPFQKISTPIKQ